MRVFFVCVCVGEKPGASRQWGGFVAKCGVDVCVLWVFRTICTCFSSLATHYMLGHLKSILTVCASEGRTDVEQTQPRYN